MHASQLSLDVHQVQQDFMYSDTRHVVRRIHDPETGAMLMEESETQRQEAKSHMQETTAHLEHLAIDIQYEVKRFATVCERKQAKADEPDWLRFAYEDRLAELSDLEENFTRVVRQLMLQPLAVSIAAGQSANLRKWHVINDKLLAAAAKAATLGKRTGAAPAMTIDSHQTPCPLLAPSLLSMAEVPELVMITACQPGGQRIGAESTLQWQCTFRIPNVASRMGSTGETQSSIQSSLSSLSSLSSIVSYTTIGDIWVDEMILRCIPEYRSRVAWDAQYKLTPKLMEELNQHNAELEPLQQDDDDAEEMRGTGDADAHDLGEMDGVE